MIQLVLRRMPSLLHRLRDDEEGATMVEYAIMVGFIAAVCVLGVTALGVATRGLFER